MNMGGVDIKHRRAHGVDQHDVEVAVVPADDTGPVFVAEIDLPLRDHCLRSIGLLLPRPPFLASPETIIAVRTSEPHQPPSIPRTAASTSALVSCQSLSRLATTCFMNGSHSRIAFRVAARKVAQSPSVGVPGLSA